MTIQETVAEGPAAALAASEISARTSTLVVALCWFAIFAEGYDVGVLGAILPALSNEASWSLTPLQLGAFGSYTLVGMLIGGLAGGTLSEIHGRRPTFLACLSLFSVCMLAAAWSPSPTWFAVSRGIGGLGLGGIIPVAAALTTEYSPARRKSLNYGIMYSGYSVGILAAALTGKALLPEHGWRPVVLIGALPLLTLPFLYALLPESLEFLVARGARQKAQALARRLNVALPPPVVRPQAMSWQSVVGEIFAAQNARATVCFWSALFMGMFLVYGLAQWLPQIMRRSGYDLGDSLLFLAVFSFTSAIGGIVLGLWADRLGPKRTVTLSYVAGAAGIFALSFKGSIAANYAAVALAGFGTVSASLILTSYLATYLKPMVRAAGVGWALSFSRIGALCGPLIGGYIASLAVTPEWNFYVFAAAAAMAALATALIPARSAASR